MNSPDDRQRLLTSYALTLFILGVMIGLLAILGRLAQEFQHRLVVDIDLLMVPRATAKTRLMPLRPLIDTLGDSGSRFVVFGFLVSLITMSCGGAIWFLGGKPNAPHARTWTRLGSAIGVCLLISMFSTVFIADEDVRLALIAVPAVLALLLYAAFVYLVAEKTWNVI
jgi:hypothetical protein